MKRGYLFTAISVAFFSFMATAAPGVELGLGHDASTSKVSRADYAWIDVSGKLLRQNLDVLLLATQVDNTNGVTAQTELGDTYVAPGKLKFLSIRGGVGYMFNPQNFEYYNIGVKAKANLPRGLQHLDLFGTAGVVYENAFDKNKYDFETATYSLGIGKVVKGHTFEVRGFAQRITDDHFGIELVLTL